MRYFRHQHQSDDPAAPVSDTYFGQISLKSSILILPAGLSPMETSKKTMGRPLVPAPGNAVDAIPKHPFHPLSMTVLLPLPRVSVLDTRKLQHSRCV